tara:strand:- start:748 stop:3117 length:2370 start_codon:yes stop_codon:yes gene_type:complete
MIRNEKFLLEKLLPIWKKYVDGFVFLVDTSIDGTEEYLKKVSEQYNILDILVQHRSNDVLWVASEVRQKMFDAAKKYTNKIVCLDADEYFDGSMSKQELEDILDSHKDTLFNLKWIQYTSLNTIRVDGPWKDNIKGRIGVFNTDCVFRYDTMHATHLPIQQNQFLIPEERLFIAHLQWLDKNIVGLKQYCYKIEDYTSNKKFGANVVDKEAYDASINNFNWEEEYYDYPLKINEDIYEHIINSEYYRFKIIKENTKELNIPNLGDWGLNIHHSVPMYFCTAADEKHYLLLLNMIGGIHKHNFYDTIEIRVYDLGLSDLQKRELQNIKKVKLCEVEKTNDSVLTDIQTSPTRFVKGLFSWKPILIKDSLDHQPYTLYLDAGTSVRGPLNNLFKHIIQNKYLFFDCGHSIKWMTTKYNIENLDLQSKENMWILDDNIFGIDAGFMGISKDVYNEFILPMYELSKNIKNFEDDGSCPDGWGTGRHDQTLFSVIARKLKYNIFLSKDNYKDCNLLVDNKKINFHITHTKQNVEKNTIIHRSRWDIYYELYKNNIASIKRNYKISVITAIGDLNKYEKFISQYFQNITQQIGFSRFEFIIVYSEWTDIFNDYVKYNNIKFIKENEKNGVYNAWNIGVANSVAEYITNWNVDDIRFNINTIMKYDLLSKNIDIDLAYNYYIGIEEGEDIETIDIDNKNYIKYPDNFHDQVLSMCMAGPDPMWRKSANLFYGLFNYQEYNIIGDWEMWIRMAKNGLKFKLIPHVLSIYVNHKNTVSNSNNEQLEIQKSKLINQYSK